MPLRSPSPVRSACDPKTKPSEPDACARPEAAITAADAVLYGCRADIMRPAVAIAPEAAAREAQRKP